MSKTARRRTIREDGPHPVDMYVGQRLRQRRVMLGLSQTALGDKIGVSFQQLQKFEKGVNRMGSSRLYQMATALDVPVSYFFDGLNEAEISNENTPPKKDSKKGKPPMKRETLQLVRSYYQIRCGDVRANLMTLIRSLSDAGTKDD